jgi:uncharacterized protein YkwD
MHVLTRYFCALPLAVFPLAALGQSLPARAAPPDMAQVAGLIVEATNDFRRGEGAAPVERNALLEAAAREFAEFMAHSGRYGHDADGSSPSERAKGHGYDYCIVSENIAYAYNSVGFTTSFLVNKFVEGWKDSPGHRKNMLDGDVLDTAVAVVQSDRGYYYAVQMFGRQSSASLRFQVRNNSGLAATYRLGAERFTLEPGAGRTHTGCRSEALALEGSREEGIPFTTRNGDRFRVVGDRNRISLKRD